MNGDTELLRDIHSVVHATAAIVAELPRKNEVTESIHTAIREHTTDCRKRPSRAPAPMDPTALLKWIVAGLVALAAILGGGAGINAVM